MKKYWSLTLSQESAAGLFRTFVDKTLRYIDSEDGNIAMFIELKISSLKNNWILLLLIAAFKQEYRERNIKI